MGRSRIGLLTMLVLGPLLIAGTGVGQRPIDSSIRLRVQPQSRLWIAGTSTLRSFECTAEAFDLRVDADLPDPVLAVMAGERAVRTVQLRVPVERLDCANGTMNDHMWRSLRADQHPEIAFTLASYELSGSGEAMLARLTGTLTIGGTQKTIALDAAASRVNPQLLRVGGSYALQMSDFGLRAPTLMLGTLRVGDRVVVHFDLYLDAPES